MRRDTVRFVRAARVCSKPVCTAPAVATLTYVYADSTVVVGHLAIQAEPHSYDLCAAHAEGFVAPRGWDVIHVHQELVDLAPSADDIDALARAVRDAGAGAQAPVSPVPLPDLGEPRRGHLRVVSSGS